MQRNTVIILASSFLLLLITGISVYCWWDDNYSQEAQLKQLYDKVHLQAMRDGNDFVSYYNKGDSAGMYFCVSRSLLDAMRAKDDLWIFNYTTDTEENKLYMDLKKAYSVFFEVLAKHNISAQELEGFISRRTWNREYTSHTDIYHDMTSFDGWEGKNPNTNSIYSPYYALLYLTGILKDKRL